jgi:transcriptional repressor NrdR
VERELQELGEKEIRTSVIGEAVMRRLRELDEVAYVRFASVYRAFRDVGEFMTELEGLAKTSPLPASPPAGAGGVGPRKKNDS